MAKGKHRNTTNRNLGNMAASEPNSLTSASPGYANKPEKQDMDLKSLVMMLVQEHMKDILKEIQEKMDQKLEALARETQKSLKEIQENTKANKEEMQKTLKEIQENFGQQAEVMKEETQKALKELQENTKQESEGAKQNHPGSKIRSRNN